MKTIGITGKAGAGKTTLSNLLAQKSQAKIIHLDYLMDGVKEKTVLKILTSDTKQIDGQEHSYRLMKKNLSDFIYNNKIILKIYLILKNKIKGQILEKMIKEFEKDTELVIIEGFDLLNFRIAEKLDFLILVKAPYYERIDRLSNRDGIADKKWVVLIDKKLQKNLRGKSKKRKEPDYIIENTESIDSLEKHCDYILENSIDNNTSNSQKFRVKYKAPNNRIKSQKIPTPTKNNYNTIAPLSIDKDKQR